VLLGSLVLKEKPVSLVLPDRPDHKVSKANKVSKVCKVLREILGHKGQQVLLVLREKLDPLVLLVLREQLAQLVRTRCGTLLVHTTLVLRMP
jgi:hypothetical protein